MFQQEHYSVKEYLIHVLNYYIKTPYIYPIYLCFFLLIDTYKELELLIYLIVLCVSFVFLFIKENFIIKLKFTKKIIRYITIILLFYVILIVLTKSIFTSYLLLYIEPLLVIFTKYLLLPFDKLIYQKYKKNTKRSLDSLNSVKILITGSCGKTTVKDIIYEVISTKYITFKTPKSYNTPMGLSLCINNKVSNLTKVLILEAGARKSKDIRELTEMVSPHIGVITSITSQHLDTFKTFDNIVRTKSELISSISKDSTLILNLECDLIREYMTRSDIQYETINSIDSIYYCSNVIYDDEHTSFNILSKKDLDYCLHIDTKLIGLHQVDNILLVYLIIQKLKDFGINISDKEFQKSISMLSNSKSRLEKKIITNGSKNIYFFDDSYNSNIVGYRNALDLLSLTKTKKALITPGIVENKNVKYEAYTKYFKVIDDICLVNNKGISKIIDTLVYHNINYYVFDSFIDAYNYIVNKYKDKEDVSLLVANDLPDSYLRRWVYENW